MKLLTGILWGSGLGKVSNQNVGLQYVVVGLCLFLIHYFVSETLFFRMKECMLHQCRCFTLLFEVWVISKCARLLGQVYKVFFAVSRSLDGIPHNHSVNFLYLLSFTSAYCCNFQISYSRYLRACFK